MSDTIIIHESELAEMRLFYQTELDKTLKRLHHIQGILTKLGYKEVKGLKINIEPNSASVKKSNIIKLAPKSRAARSGKKRGPVSVWSNFVLNKLTQESRPLTYDQLVDGALAFSNLPESHRKKVQQSITNVTFKLRNKEHKIDTFSMGSRIKYIGLAKWFDANGSIQKEFKDRAEIVVPKNHKSKSRASGKIRISPIKKTPATTVAKPVAATVSKSKKNKATVKKSVSSKKVKAGPRKPTSKKIALQETPKA